MLQYPTPLLDFLVSYKRTVHRGIIYVNTLPMDNLVKKLHLIKENPGYYNALSPEEQAELFIFLLTPKKKIFQKPVEIVGKDGVTPVKNVDYLSKEATLKTLEEIQVKVQEKLDSIHVENGKDAVITPEIINDILDRVLDMVVLPEYVPYDDTAITERIENAELDHAELRDEVDTLKKNVTTQFVGGGVSANWVKNYVATNSGSISWINYVSGGQYTGVTTTIADGDVLTYLYNSATIYRHITTATDAYGYPTEDAFYTTFSNPTLSGLIVARG